MTEIGDSAYPLAAGTYPATVEGWGFYIGGDTPHIWTDAEIAALPYRYRLPIYTRSNPNGASQGVTDASAAGSWMLAHQQPPGTLVQLDFETAIDPPYVTAFDGVIVKLGYKTLLYGSESTVLDNPEPSGGYNVANWDGIDADPSWTAKQYKNTTYYDLNDFNPTAPLWDTQPPMKDSMDPLFSVQPDPANPTTNQGIWWTGAGTYTHVPDITDVANLEAAGAPEINISYPFHQAILNARQTIPTIAPVTLQATGNITLSPGTTT